VVSGQWREAGKPVSWGWMALNLGGNRQHYLTTNQGKAAHKLRFSVQLEGRSTKLTADHCPMCITFLEMIGYKAIPTTMRFNPHFSTFPESQAY
jgi:hypothetical protein